MEYGFVSEFELLRNARSHQDITREAWTLPAHREITSKYYKILHAREEIHRVNIEMCRLRTSIRDEHLLYEEHIKSLQVTDPHLATALQDRYDWRARLNVNHIRVLDKIEALKGFTGIPGEGTRRGTMSVDGPVSGVPDGIVDRACLSMGHELLLEEQQEEGDDDEYEEVAIDFSEALLAEPVVNGIPNSMIVNWALS